MFFRNGFFVFSSMELGIGLGFLFYGKYSNFLFSDIVARKFHFLKHKKFFETGYFYFSGWEIYFLKYKKVQFLEV